MVDHVRWKARTITNPEMSLGARQAERFNMEAFSWCVDSRELTTLEVIQLRDETEAHTVAVPGGQC